MMVSRGIDVAVIGSGPAGLAAAISAKEAGAENVTIFERAEQPGWPGFFFQSSPSPFESTIRSLSRRTDSENPRHGFTGRYYPGPRPVSEGSKGRDADS